MVPFPPSRPSVRAALPRQSAGVSNARPGRLKEDLSAFPGSWKFSSPPLLRPPFGCATIRTAGEKPRFIPPARSGMNFSKPKGESSCPFYPKKSPPSAGKRTKPNHVWRTRSAYRTEPSPNGRTPKANPKPPCSPRFLPSDRARARYRTGTRSFPSPLQTPGRMRQNYGVFPSFGHSPPS